MNQRLGARKRRRLGIPAYEGQDMMFGVLIDPDFYGFLKEEGLPTARRADGTYWDAESQRRWVAWQAEASNAEITGLSG